MQPADERFPRVTDNCRTPSFRYCFNWMTHLAVFPSFRFKTNYSIAVLPMSKIKIVCPNPAMIPITVQGSTPKEELYENLWMVEKQAYDACAIDTSKYQNRLLMRCDTPLQLRYFTIVFQRFSAVGPDGLEFEPGKGYYFIGK